MHLLNRALLLLAFSLYLAAPARSAGVLGDITIPRQKGSSGGAMPQALFPHWIHRTRYKCYACHDDLFQMRSGADKITMDAIQNGEFCSVCHDGKKAFEVGFDTCEKCHRAPTVVK